jgi:hypothetical protein
MSRLTPPRVPLLPPSTVAGVAPPATLSVKEAFARAFAQGPEPFRVKGTELPVMAKQTLAAAGRCTGAAYRVDVGDAPFYGAYTFDEERQAFELAIFDGAGHSVASGLAAEDGAPFSWSTPQTGRRAIGVKEFAHGAVDEFSSSSTRRPPGGATDRFERPGAKVRDETPLARVETHRKTYGDTPVFYPDALALAARAVLEDGSESSPRRVLEQSGLADVEGELARRLSRGSLTLLKAGRADSFGTDPSRWWIFEVNLDAGSGHGFWARVNRQTGEAHVQGQPFGGR